MLNQLVRKYPEAARLYPTTREEALADEAFPPKQLDLVTMMVD